MVSQERRLGPRVPLPIFVDQYVNDHPTRALAADLSPTGIRLKTVALPGTPQAESSRSVSLEIGLPGTDDTIWARGEIRYTEGHGAVRASGIRFTAMPQAHAKLLRDYCAEARRLELVRLLSRVRGAAA